MREAGPMDAVVVGTGPNGLVAANLLAERGWDVLALEAAPEPGGAVRSTELIEPGFVNDLCSAFYPLAAGSPIFRSLELEQHGLRWRHAPLVLAHPTPDDCPVLTRDLACTVASLDAVLRPFPPVRALPGLLARRPHDLLRLARFALLPVRRLGQEEFRGQAARRLLAGAALHADLMPESTLSGFFGWLMCALG